MQSNHRCGPVLAARTSGGDGGSFHCVWIWDRLCKINDGIDGLFQGCPPRLLLCWFVEVVGVRGRSGRARLERVR